MAASMGLKEDDVIESGLVTKQIANAQRKVEAHNFDIRKNLLDFDDVNNDQRKVIYQQRDEVLDADSVADSIEGIREDVVADMAMPALAAQHQPAEERDVLVPRQLVLAVRAVRRLDHDPRRRRIVDLRLAEDFAAVAPPLPLQPARQAEDHHVEEAAEREAQRGRGGIAEAGVLVEERQSDHRCELEDRQVHERAAVQRGGDRVPDRTHLRADHGAHVPQK